MWRKSPYLLAPVLQILHQALLDDLKLPKLDLVNFPVPLQFLRRVFQALPVPNTRRSDRQGALRGDTPVSR